MSFLIVTKFYLFLLCYIYITQQEAIWTDQNISLFCSLKILSAWPQKNTQDIFVEQVNWLSLALEVRNLKSSLECARLSINLRAGNFGYFLQLELVWIQFFWSIIYDQFLSKHGTSLILHFRDFIPIFSFICMDWKFILFCDSQTVEIWF